MNGMNSDLKRERRDLLKNTGDRNGSNGSGVKQINKSYEEFITRFNRLPVITIFRDDEDILDDGQMLKPDVPYFFNGKIMKLKEGGSVTYFKELYWKRYQIELTEIRRWSPKRNPSVDEQLDKKSIQMAKYNGVNYYLTKFKGKKYVTDLLSKLGIDQGKFRNFIMKSDISIWEEIRDEIFKKIDWNYNNGRTDKNPAIIENFKMLVKNIDNFVPERRQPIVKKEKYFFIKYEDDEFKITEINGDEIKQILIDCELLNKICTDIKDYTKDKVLILKGAIIKPQHHMTLVEI